MKTWSRLSCLAAVIVGLVAVPPAQADSGVLRDARGDARASWDITRIGINNGSQALRVGVHYRGSLNFGGLGLLMNVKLDFGDPAEDTILGDYTIDLLRSSEYPDTTRTELYRGSSRLECGGLRARWRQAAGIVDVTVPQACFGDDAGRLRANAYTYRPRADPKQADYIDKWSRWVARG